MGLSNWERNKKVIWSIHHIHNLIHEIKKCEDDYFESTNPYVKLRQYLDKLWPVLLAGRRNGGFWLIGSDDSVQEDNDTIWSTAICANIKDCDAPEDEDVRAVKAKIEAEEDLCICDCQSDYFKIEDFLSPRNAAVYNIYNLLQNIQYATNRYDDTLSEQYAEMNNLIADCMGAIFSILVEEKEFTVAYLKHEIAKILVGSTYRVKKEDADAVQMLVDKYYLHQEISSYKPDCAPCYEVYYLKLILKSLTICGSLKNRMGILLFMVGKNMAKYHAKSVTEAAKSVGIIWQINKVPKEKDTDREETTKFYRNDLLGIDN